MKATLELLIPFLLLILFWEAGSQLMTHMFLVLPPPSRILWQMWIKSDRFLLHAAATLKVMGGGFFLAFVIAFPLAWVMERSHSIRHVLQPIFVAIQCIPMFALGPIMVIWFGWTYTALIIPTALMIFFPLTVNIYQGLRSTPKAFVEYFESNQATFFQTFFKLQLPWAIPHIFAGLKIAASIAGIGAVAGEWAGAQSGLGILMLESRRAADLEMMFGAFICLTIISLSLYGIITLIERQVIKRKFFYLAKKSIPIIVCGLIFAGCQQPSENSHRLMLDWFPNPNHVPLYVALEKGFFEENGVKIHLHKVNDPADPIPYLTSRQTEIIISYMPSALQAIIHGADITPIGVLVPSPLNAIIFQKDGSIKNPSDLNGKVIGYSIDGAGTAFLEYLLRVNHIKPKEMRNISFDLFSTLGTKQVDAVYGAFWNIECEQLRCSGVETDYLSLFEMGFPNYSELVFFAHSGSPQASENFKKRFQKGLQKAIDYSKQYPEQAFAIYQKANPDKGQNALQWEINAWKKTFPLFASSQAIDEEQWNQFGAWLLEVLYPPVIGE